mmetsp:Transcript_32250/g.55748  ORF Transcript_32250/g.55748 Transcript_32250/m.55748 type:complete len:358 (-) Transcript_32250:55-1128(-)
MGCCTTRNRTTEVLRMLKEGMSVFEAAQTLELSAGEVVAIVANKSGLPTDKVRVVLKMSEGDHSLAHISKELSISDEVMRDFVPTTPAAKLAYMPSYIYSFKHQTSELFRTQLTSSDETSHIVETHTFLDGSIWCEALEGQVYVLGGFTKLDKASHEVVSINPGNEFSVKTEPHMKTARGSFGVVYHKSFIYVVGGAHDLARANSISDCERYNIEESKWESFNPLPQACSGTSLIAFEFTQCIYAFGGYAGERLNTIQRLTLGSLNWDLMFIHLPVADNFICAFKLQSYKIFFITGDFLFAFVPSASVITRVKPMNRSVSSVSGPSYYSNCTIYTSSNAGPAAKCDVGSLKFSDKAY